MSTTTLSLTAECDRHLVAVEVASQRTIEWIAVVPDVLLCFQPWDKVCGQIVHSLRGETRVTFNPTKPLIKLANEHLKCVAFGRVGSF